MQVTLKGNPVSLSGTFPTVGSKLPDFTLTSSALADVGLSEFSGKKKVISIVPSLDTPACATSTQKFNAEIGGKDDVQVIVVSADLPFAAGRFCTSNSTDNVTTLSTFRSPSFAADYGVLIGDGALAGLTSRAVIVADENDNVIYVELVSEITQEPNYDAVLAAL